jgi:hypothetical protein
LIKATSLPANLPSCQYSFGFGMLFAMMTESPAGLRELCIGLKDLWRDFAGDSFDAIP